MDEWSRQNVEQRHIGDSKKIKKTGEPSDSGLTLTMTEEQLVMPEFQDPVYPDELLDYLAASIDDSIQNTISGQGGAVSNGVRQNVIPLENYNQQNNFVLSENQISVNEIVQSSNIDPNLRHPATLGLSNGFQNFSLPAFDNGSIENFSLDFLISDLSDNSSKVIPPNSEIIFGELQDQFRQSERTLGGVQNASRSDDAIGHQFEGQINSPLDPELFALPMNDPVVQFSDEIPSYAQVFGIGQASVIEEFQENENLLSFLTLESSLSSPAMSTQSGFVMDNEVLVMTNKNN
jgi:hypothetical protein